MFYLLIILVAITSGCCMTCEPALRVRYDQLETVMNAYSEHEPLTIVDYAEPFVPTIKCRY